MVDGVMLERIDAHSLGLPTPISLRRMTPRLWAMAVKR